MSKYPKFCSSCGAELLEGQKFCARCGAKVIPIVTDEDAAPAPPAPERKPERARKPVQGTPEPKQPSKPQPNKPKPRKTSVPSGKRPVLGAQPAAENKAQAPDCLPIAQIAKRYRTAQEAGELAETLGAEWYLTFGMLAGTDELRKFCAEIDQEYTITDGDEKSFYVVDDNGAIGITNDGGRHINWFVRAMVRAIPFPSGKPAESPKDVIADEVRQKIQGFKSIFNLKALPKKILITAAMLAAVWLVSLLFKRFFPSVGNSGLMNVVNYLTFAAGGLSANYFYQLGGIFGKMLVSATLFTIVLGGFKLIPKGITAMRQALSSMNDADDKTAKALIACGVGSAMVLYNFFTGDARLSLSMVGFAGALSMLWAMGGGIHFIRRMVVACTASRTEYSGDIRMENIPRTMQVLAGMAVGFLLSVLASMFAGRYTLYYIGEFCIIMAFVSLKVKAKPKKAVGAAMVAGLIFCAPNAYAALTQSDIDSEPVWETNDPHRIYRAEDMTQKQLDEIFDHLGLPRESDMPFLLHEHEGRTYEAIYDVRQPKVDYTKPREEGEEVEEFQGYLPGPLQSVHFCAGAPGLGAIQAAANAAGSLVAILLVLMGSLGTKPVIPTGIPPVSSSQIPPTSGGSAWIKYDQDGDIEYTDPGTGKKSTWVRQEDGRFRKAGEGSVATEEELREWAEHADRNKEYYDKANQLHEQAVREQHESLQKEIEEKNRQNELERLRRAEEKAKQEAREDYIHNLKDKYGVITDEELRQAIVDEQIKNGVERDKALEKAKWLDAAVTTCEVTKSVADLAIDVLADYTGPAGKIVATAYTYTSEIAGGVSEAYATGGNLTEAAAAGFSKASLTMVENAAGNLDSQLAKYAINSLCEGIKNGIDGLKDGKTPAEIFKDYLDGTATGLKDTYIDSLTGGMAEIVKSEDAAAIAKLMTDGKIPAEHVDALAKIFSAIGKAAT